METQTQTTEVQRHQSELACSGVVPVETVRKINELHKEATHHRDLAVGQASMAVQKVIECGMLLIEAQDKVRHGDWLLWLEVYCPDISIRTAQRYICAARKYAMMSQDAVDFQSVKQLYIAAGIMPEPVTVEASTPPKATDWFRWTVKVESTIPKLSDEDKFRLRSWCLGLLRKLNSE